MKPTLQAGIEKLRAIFPVSPNAHSDKILEIAEGAWWAGATYVLNAQLDTPASFTPLVLEMLDYYRPATVEDAK